MKFKDLTAEYIMSQEWKSGNPYYSGVYIDLTDEDGEVSPCIILSPNDNFRYPDVYKVLSEMVCKEHNKQLEPVIQLPNIFEEAFWEYKRAAAKFPAFRSDREGFDILDEEVQELKQAIRHGTKEQARTEAIQVLAMAARLVLDCYPEE